MYLQRWHGWCHMKLLPSWRVLCTPYNHAPCHFMQSHIRKVHECLAVTCLLHFWQNGRGLLCASVVRRGWNGYLSCLKLLTCMYYHASSAPPFLYQEPKWKKIYSQSGSSTSWRSYIKISLLSWCLSKNVSRFYSQLIWFRHPLLKSVTVASDVLTYMSARKKWAVIQGTQRLGSTGVPKLQG